MDERKPKKLYSKLFLTYGLIAFFIIAVLVGYFVVSTRGRILENRQREADKMRREILTFVQERADTADSLHRDLYRSRQELNDLIAYLDSDPEDYQRYKLDYFSGTNSSSYRDIYNFISDAFDTHPEMEKIELLSYSRKELTECYPQEEVYPGKDGTQRILELSEGDSYSGEDQLVFQKEIRNPDTLEPEGLIVFTFPCGEYLREIVEDQNYADYLVTQNYVSTVYSSVEEQPAEWAQVLERDRAGERETLPSYNILRDSVDEYEIYVFLYLPAASALPMTSFLAIIGVGATALIVGILLIHFYVRRLTVRVDAILNGMDEVTRGNLEVSLQVNRDRDELDMISGNFNVMCQKLKDYIQKSYLAEIEKKNAEIQAWQSQINPHFLYNTLEAIRMKAICNGDREVGKMLYSMSVLFRSQLKEADWITVGQELDYCKQYLELFECRYQGIFRYEIICPVELMGTKVIKFILQPIIENYFIHGIRRQDQDNFLQIEVERLEKELCFLVRDNGLGMEEELLKKKNEVLQKNIYEEKEKNSIGLSNVNRRVKAVYGEAYGVTITAVKTGGIEVCIKVRIEEEKDETDYAGGR